jgi:hypothetical protein
MSGMSRSPIAIAVACALLLTPAALPAQSANQSEGQDAKSDILVTGKIRKVDPRKVTHEARSISRETDVLYEPLARFEGYACPGVIGLKQAYAEAFVGRLRQIAEELHIPLAKNGDCKANIVVAFTDDGRADLAKMQRKTKFLSQLLDPSERHELLDEPGPVRVVSVVETRMQNGSLVPRAQHLAESVGELPTGRMEGGQSLISTGSQREIASVMVLFDRSKIKGKSLQQLADYTVMRVFAYTRDAKGGKAPDSILTLFDEGNDSPPQQLTEFDRAYLTTLYEGPAHVRGIGKLLRVAQNLDKLHAINGEWDYDGEGSGGGTGK